MDKTSPSEKRRRSLWGKLKKIFSHWSISNRQRKPLEPTAETNASILVEVIPFAVKLQQALPSSRHTEHLPTNADEDEEEARLPSSVREDFLSSSSTELDSFSSIPSFSTIKHAPSTESNQTIVPSKSSPVTVESSTLVSPKKTALNNGVSPPLEQTSPLPPPPPSLPPSQGSPKKIFLAPHFPLKPSTTSFSWPIARQWLHESILPANTIILGGKLFKDWPLIQIPTLGATKYGCRVQKLYKCSFTSEEKRETFHLFVKKIPYEAWKMQLTFMDYYNGDYVTDGENFVMEAAVLTYFKRNHIGLAPHLVAILEECSSTSSERLSSSVLTETPLSSSTCKYVCIVSELYGEDLLYYIERRIKEKTPFNSQEKRVLQWKAMEIVKTLHEKGLCHLDITPENILMGPRGMKLCDFGKTTPFYSTSMRHVKGSNMPTEIPFESCEPTVGKAAYMPPECWSIYRLLEEHRIRHPLEDLRHLTSADKRKSFYFRVENADVYMVGILMFWIWSNGCIWKYSDPRTDVQFQTLVTYDMNVDVFHECQNWPIPLKDLLKRTLNFRASSRESLQTLIMHQWWKYPVQPTL